MMTFIALIAGLGLITAIARYNEDDSLFWKLAVSFIGAMVATEVVTTVIDQKKQDKVITISEMPTQVQYSMPSNLCSLAGMTITAPTREKSPKPVSKDSLTKTNDSILSEVVVSARGQPRTAYCKKILRNCAYINTS